MEIPLSGIGLGLIILAIVTGFVVLFVLDIGLGLATDQLWEWLKRRRKRKRRFPWTDRTGTWED